MILDGVEIEDTFAEAFGMRATRLIVTADTPRWARIAGDTATGFATSVIACGAEAGIERDLSAEETPDGRPGIALLFFAVSRDALTKALRDRVGQCVLTCPGTACYSGLDEGERLPLGRSLRYFGDGYQAAKRLGDKRYWRIPVMDGEFVCEDTVGQVKAVGGGNFLILGKTHRGVLAAAERAVEQMRRLIGVIMPFPGGIARSGSKIGSRYKGLVASTNDAYCPTIKGIVKTALPPSVDAVLEIVIDGLNEAAVGAAMATGIRAACAGNDGEILRITAGNYGGKLGPFHFRLHELLA
ncbi:MAG: formylmethanofuran--tetrahydromethanopterin N-formyltransferase [Rhodospirillales bacterium]|jgi:formylmethanofuran--tetrahydromethanopterin N-formyltransferase|nr:formylmethanofuran--tetrahydromethanopterin N-formyltransferase [Rhodospirillales bacterium]